MIELDGDQVEPDSGRPQSGFRYYLVGVGVRTLLALLFGVSALVLRSWVLSLVAVVLAVAAGLSGLRIARNLSDRRKFGGFGLTAQALDSAGEFHELYRRAMRVANGARSRPYRSWGLEWAAYALELIGDKERMRLFVDEQARKRLLQPHIPARIYAAVGEFDRAATFWERAVFGEGGDRHLPALIDALVKTGDTARTHRLIRRIYRVNKRSVAAEWLAWSALEQGNLEPARRIIGSVDEDSLSQFGWSVYQVAVHRCGEYSNALDIGMRAIESKLMCDQFLATVHYNLACSFARLGHATDALAELAKVEDLGVLAHAATDPELEPLREAPAFAEAMAKVRSAEGLAGPIEST